MAITKFDPVSYQMVKADGRTPHADITLKISTNDQDTENAVSIDIEAQPRDGAALTGHCNIRRDMAFNFAHRIREELHEMGVLTSGEHAVNSQRIFMQSKEYDVMFKKIRQSLNIDPTETIDLERFLHSGD